MFSTAASIIALSLAALLPLAIMAGVLALRGLLRGWSDSRRGSATLWMLAGSALSAVVLQPRVLNFTDGTLISTLASTVSVNPLGTWISRGFTGGLIALSLTTLLNRRRGEPYRRERASVRQLMFALVGFYVLTVIAGFLFSTESGFNRKALYGPLVLLPLLMLRDIDWPRIAFNAKLILTGVLFAGLVLAIVLPDFVLERPYSGSLLGLSARLYGVTNHANSLGFVAAVLLLLEFDTPSKPPARVFVVALAVANIILAQSKTVWVALLIVLFASALPHWFSTRRHAPGSQKQILGMVISLIGLILVSAPIIGTVGVDYLSRPEVLSLTGRTDIWRITLSEFVRNPMFGYGPDLWGPEYRMKATLLNVGQAHNQFVNTLGESGLFGITLLIAYLLVLGRASIQKFISSQGLTISLFTLLIVRSFTEAPFRPAIGAWDFFCHALLLIRLVADSYQAPNGTQAEPTRSSA